MGVQDSAIMFFGSAKQSQKNNGQAENDLFHVCSGLCLLLGGESKNPQPSLVVASVLSKINLNIT